MDIVLNDYAFEGQFESTESFALWIQREWIKIFDFLTEHEIALYKKSDFYSRNITADKTIRDLLKTTNDPIISKIKTFIIQSAFSEPYWDMPSVMKTDLRNTYSCPFQEELPNCFSESIERDKVILSVKNEHFSESHYQYLKNEKSGSITNIVDYNSFLCWLLYVSSKDIRYVFENYPLERKIMFAEIEGRCYAEEALLGNDLTIEDKQSILLHFKELIQGLSTGTKNRFWDSLTNGIFEYRITVSAGREFRLLFFQKDAIIFLNGFIKKQSKTPKDELDKALMLKKLL